MHQLTLNASYEFLIQPHATRSTTHHPRSYARILHRPLTPLTSGPHPKLIIESE